jgi:hypothetical protein
MAVGQEAKPYDGGVVVVGVVVGVNVVVVVDKDERESGQGEPRWRGIEGFFCSRTKKNKDGHRQGWWGLCGWCNEKWIFPRADGDSDE